MNRFKRNAMMVLAVASTICANAQAKDVTTKYIENADFQARFAAWVNPGSFTYNVATTFEGKSGEVWMEKWVSQGGTLNNNDGMYQTLTDLPTGTYTLVVAAKNIQQSSKTKVCKGAYIYAGQEQTEISTPGDYSVVFTVVNGKTNIGIRLSGCDGNWVCVDNFRLYYNGENTDSIAAEQTRLDNELAEFKAHLENATGTAPKVKTYGFVPTGNTIALGRSTVTGTAKEKGFCWSSTNPEPSILDEKSTETFSNNGDIYVMRNLKPATTYYVRAYAMTSGYKVAYGEVVKINTLPAGNMSYGFFNDNGGDEATCARINSASAECIWMYNNLSYIPGFYLSVHYVPGAGAGGGTADCSYGGWMRVSQNVPYQQTGTMLHETNHGVGVGTTGAWYNNANLRAETSRGLWLGPMGTKMVRFFENSETATMTGDNTHMWPYGINGANEDSYQPSKQVLYYANILITHALHQDGLPCTSGVGFASPAYVFQQDDNAKYYIKCEDANAGGTDAYLTMTSTGTLRSMQVSAAEAAADDNYAWHITYDPKTRYYVFQNIGSGKFLTNNNGTIKGVTKNTATTTEKFHLMPSRQPIEQGAYKGESYWVMTGSGHKALEGGSYNSTNKYYSVTTKDYNAANAAVAQRWVLLKADEALAYDRGAVATQLQELKDLVENVKTNLATPHKANSEETDVETTDNALQSVLDGIEGQMESYSSPTEVNAAIQTLTDAVLSFLSNVSVTDAGQPFNITYFLTNTNLDNDCAGWSTTTAINYSCAEFFEKTADFNQTTIQRMPVGTYKLMVQGFQRPGAYADVLTEWQAGTNNVKGVLYLKTTNKLLKNIYKDAQEKTQGTGSVAAASKVYIPNSMQGAYNFFRRGFYENEVIATTKTSATMKVGIKTNVATAGTWTCFDNFRLFYYGNVSEEVITGISDITPNSASDNVYDLSGRRVAGLPQTKGIYIKNGKKLVYE